MTGRREGQTEGCREGGTGERWTKDSCPSTEAVCPWCRPGPSCVSLTGPWPLSSLALAGSPLAQQGCAEGPTFWCRSLATAVRCGAVQICAQAGWNQAAKEDMCADCGQIVTILTRMAKDSAFKDSIQKYLTHECTLLPLHTLVPHCQKVVDTYFTLFIACLEGQIKPASICGRLGLCPTDPSQDQSQHKCVLQLLQGLRLDLPDGQTQRALTLTFNHEGEPPLVPLLAQSAECQACVAVMGLAKSTVQANSTVADVEAALLGACSSAHLGWQECKSFMEWHWPRLLTLLPKAWDPQSMCQELGVCEAGTGPAPGAEGCTLGPAYWCSSLETAEQCQAVQHCQAHGWA
ncbi:prosaposin-like [Terrapene carolina triunguis]|uniref:prosaposin-like n=1 Tax=Terrapene triunguis TaxID=2587831 RepID=UPI00115621AD|nr:prosaposin-like [Terrapene carolina triunguis]